MPEINDQEEVVVEDTVEIVDDEGNDTTDWKAEALKAQGIAKRLKTKMEKSKSETKGETKVEETKPEEFGLLQKSFLRAAGITHPDDVALAKDLSKKWGVDVDALVDDEDFKLKLERQQTTRSNAEATSNIKGSGQGSSQTKNSAEYWIAKGTPPSTADVPDRKVRAKIARAMMDSAKNSKKFYND